MAVSFLRGFFTFCMLSNAFAQVQLDPNYFDVPRALSDLGVEVTDLPRTTDDSLATSARCTIACTTLAGTYGSDSIIQYDTEAHRNFTSSYFTQQQATVDPHCIFYPTKDEHLSTLVLVSRLTGCPFAVKSGGHNAFTGSSNSVGGITVALEKLNTIEVSDDRKTAVVGSGNIWTQVYTELEKYGVAAIGGRVAGIGVGGLTTGGGLSYLSNMHGWACDNVQAYEVVLANGTIAFANETTNPDLFWALRGGGNNFGIVTKFHLDLYPHGTMYAGYQIFEEQHFPALLEAYHHQVAQAVSDPHAQGWLPIGYHNKTAIAVAELTYTKNEPDPDIYKRYLDLPNVYSTRNETNLAAYTIENFKIQPDHFRNMYHTFTTLDSHDLTKFSVALWLDMVREFAIDEIASLMPAYILHPLTVPQLRNMRKRGGNALGLDTDGPAHTIHQLAIAWKDEADDERIYRFAEAFCEKVKAKAEEMGILREFIYMNYASMFQDVIAGYGAENKKRLVEVAGRYDPTGVFQRLQPGYFKLDGAPWKSVDEWAAAEAGRTKKGGKEQKTLKEEDSSSTGTDGAGDGEDPAQNVLHSEL